MCAICAWRKDCKKQYKPGGGINCPDFSRDLNVKDAEASEETPAASNKSAKKG